MTPTVGVGVLSWGKDVCAGKRSWVRPGYPVVQIPSRRGLRRSKHRGCQDVLLLVCEYVCMGFNNRPRHLCLALPV